MKIIKDFDLLSPKWLEIAFEKKNKQYGAYELRNDSSNRHLKALIIVFIVGLLTIFLPRVVSQIKWRETTDVTQQGEVKVTEFNENEQKADEQIQQEYVEPPPILQQTIQVTQWEVGEQTTTEQILTQEEISKTDIAIAAVTNTEGSKDGVNPDELKDIINVAPPKDDEVFTFVPVKARFPGGEAALNKWLNDNIVYPIAAQEIGAQGRIYVNFIVRSDGRIDGIKVVTKDANPHLAREAERLVKDMPRWQPGENDKGQKVSSYFTLPITFILK